MDLLMLQHFAPTVGDTFHASLDGMDVPFVLVEARPLAAAGGGAREPFSLLFRNGSAFLYPQMTYAMRHATLGEVGIFLVPVAQEREGFLYQAIFN